MPTLYVYVCIYIWDPICAANGLVPTSGARPSASPLLTGKLDVFSFKFLKLSLIPYHSLGWDIGYLLWVNSMLIWHHRSGSSVAKAMACCLTAPSHYLNQCTLLISEVLLHSPESNFTVSAPQNIQITPNNWDNELRCLIYCISKWPHFQFIMKDVPVRNTSTKVVTY